MGKIKKAGVCVGIAVGGLIGGTVSMIGKMADKKIIDELGENIMDSTILTGEIVGEMASGATHIVAGTVKKEPKKVKKGKKELGTAGGRVVENVITNVKNVAEQSGEILEGVKEKDKTRVAKGLRTLAKMAAVGILTVGAIKVDDVPNHGNASEAGKVPEGETVEGEKPEESGLEEEQSQFSGMSDAAADTKVEETDILDDGDGVKAVEAERTDALETDGMETDELEKDGMETDALEKAGNGEGVERGSTLEEELEKKIRF